MFTEIPDKFSFMTTQEFGQRGFNTLPRKWYYECKANFEKQTTINSHFLFDGGLFKIPEEYNETFYKLYATSLENSERNFIHEQRSDPFFPFYLDLDFLTKYPINDYNCKNIVTTIVTELQKWVFVQKRNERMLFIVAGSSPVEKPVGEEIYYKFGLHIHFPFLLVPADYARDMVLFLQENVAKKIPIESIESSKPWTDIIDSQVHTTSTGKPRGLRMIGSRKAEMCQTCKQKGDSKNCTVCDGTQKQDMGRPYWPMFIGNLSTNTSLPDRLKDINNWTILDLVRHCSVKKLPEIKIPDRLFDVYNRRYNSHPGSRQVKTFTSAPSANVNVNTNLLIGEDWINIDEDDERYKVVFKYFTTSTRDSVANWEHFYLGTKAKARIKLSYLPPGDLYTVFTNCKRCPNLIEGEHSSVCIYFRITPDNIMLKCMCKCDTVKNRKYKVTCSKWHGLKINSIPEKMKILFPHKMEDKDELGFKWRHEYSKDPEKLQLYINYQGRQMVRRWRRWCVLLPHAFYKKSQEEINEWHENFKKEYFEKYGEHI